MKSILENIVRPLLENKKLVLLVAAMFFGGGYLFNQYKVPAAPIGKQIIIESIPCDNEAHIIELH